MECLFAECTGIKQAGVPKDINASAFAGERISLAPMQRVAIVVSCDAGSEDVVVSFQEHTAAAAGDSKAFTHVSPIFLKKDAETVFTKVTTFAGTEVNAVKGVIVFEILAEELDRNGGYTHISADVAAGTAAKVIDVLYLSHDMEHKPSYEIAL